MLTIKELSAYFPYEVKVIDYNGDENYMTTLAGIQNGKVYDQTGGLLECFKLLLHPLSDLTKEIEYNGEKIVPLYRLMKEDKAFTKDFIKAFWEEELKVSCYELLLEWNFDIFGLIERGDAIDINTVKQ